MHLLWLLCFTDEERQRFSLLSSYWITFIFLCFFLISFSLWKRSQIHSLHAWVIHGAPFPACFRAFSNRSRLSLVSEVEKLTVPFRKKTPFVLTLLHITNDIMKGFVVVFLSLLLLGVYRSVHSWTWCYIPKQTCSSQLCYGLCGTCCILGKILITSLRLCVLRTADASSLLTEDYFGWNSTAR